MATIVDPYLLEEYRDGMRIIWNAPIQARDGVTLRADVFLPTEAGQYPVILSYGPYGKGQSFQEAYAQQWQQMVKDFPEILQGSSNRYQCWEVTDPERWVPNGYAVVRVDSRGAGWSEGKQHLWSQQEVEDLYDCIEWAGVQPWSNGNVGLLGISYYACIQWRVAALQPPHLKAIVPWEGASDLYREFFYHGGIRCQFLDLWMPKQEPMQYGYGTRGRRNPITGQWVAGPVTLEDEELKANRVDLVREIKAHKNCDEFYADYQVDWSKVTVPVLSSANWGGQGLHLRGNVEGFLRANTDDKWLEIHGYEHWTHFYTNYGLNLQKQFFDRFLKGEDNGWERGPKIRLQIRHVGNRFVERHEEAWPIPRTQWTKYFLDAATMALSTAAPTEINFSSYRGLEDEITFYTMPFAAETEITGPLAARLYLSSSTTDADLFLVLRLFGPDDREVVFRGAMDAYTPVAQGWLRASHRRLDERESLPWRPVHDHRAPEPLVPGEMVALDVEIWPTSIVVPVGYRLGLTIRGRDYEYSSSSYEDNFVIHRYPGRGCGPFVHNDPDDRPSDVFGGTVTVYTGGERASYLLVPVIPPE